MNIHEYQAKELLKAYGVPTTIGFAATTAAEAAKAAGELPGPIYVVKAQIHAGGRGKGRFKEQAAGEKGGVRLAKSAKEVKSIAAAMLGNTLVTAQTGPQGRVVRRVYVQAAADIDKEHYLSALVDRTKSRVAFVVSMEGGVDIEKVAHETPGKILTLSIDPATGVQPFHGRKVAFALALEGEAQKQCTKMIATSIG
jgi:Succinyl-CoA synthetase, beta subunit